MPKKPLAIDASTVLATKDKVPVAVSMSLQRGGDYHQDARRSELQSSNRISSTLQAARA